MRIADAEHGKTGVRPFGIGELPGINRRLCGQRAVGRAAIVGCGHHDDDPVLRQCPERFVHRHGPGFKPVGGGAVGNLLGNVAGGAKRGAVDHRQPLPGPARRCPVTAAGGDFHRFRDGQPLTGLPQPHPHPEIIGLDRQRLLQGQPVATPVSNGEFLQDHRQREFRLHQRELPPDAGAGPIAERFIGMRVVRQFSLRQPAFDIELIGIVPGRRMPLQPRRIDVDRSILAQLPLAADHTVLKRPDREGRGGRPQPLGFLDDPFDDLQMRQMLVGRTGVTRQHPVHLGIGLREDKRRAQQFHQRKGQQAGRGFVTCNQEGQHLITDVEIVERLSRLRIAGRQHQVEQVLGVGRMGAPFGNDRIDQPVHRLDILVELPGRFGGKALLDRQPGNDVQSLPQRFAERQQERIKLGMLEAVEAVAEAGDGNAVQRQPGHVIGDQQLLAAVPGPFRHQLVANLQDQVIIAAH